MARRHGDKRREQVSNRQKTVDGGIHPAVDGHSLVSSCVPDASHVRERCRPEIRQSQMHLPHDTVTLHFPRSFFSFIIPSIFHVFRVHRV